MKDLHFDLGGGAALRPVRHDDVDEIYALSVANQEHLRPWMPWASELARDATETYVAGALAQRDRDDGFQAVMLVDDAIVGGIGFHRIDRINLATTMGYWIAEAHQGQGVVTRAVRTLVSHAFGAWGLHRVEIDAAAANVRSRAIPERLGFVEEGVRRDGERFGERFVDLVIYSMLAPDWRG
jgi:ribosomal-protein-serine acetyltransferase